LLRLSYQTFCVETVSEVLPRRTHDSMRLSESSGNLRVTALPQFDHAALAQSVFVHE